MKIAFLSHIDINLFMFRLPIMQRLVSEGHTVYAITPRGDYFDKFEEFGIKTIEYKIERKSLNPLKELKSIRNIYRAIKPLKLDILHAFTAKPNIYGSIAGHLAKIPVTLSSVTGLGSYYINESKRAKFIKGVMEKLYREAFRKNSGVIFQNSDDLNYFVENRLVEQKKSFLVRSSGVDTGFFSPKEPNEELKATLGIKKDDIVILMVARAIWHKGLKEFIEASKIVTKTNPNAKFILVGDIDKGNPSSASKEYLNEQKSIIWLGHRDDIAELISICDIFTLPSYREGVPRTLLEASSMAKPIVTTDAVGCKEVVSENINGFLIPIKNPLALADKLKILIGDKSLREKFGTNSQIKAKKEFDVNIVVDKYLEIYKFLKNQ